MYLGILSECFESFSPLYSLFIVFTWNIISYALHIERTQTHEPTT